MNKIWIIVLLLALSQAGAALDEEWEFETFFGEVLINGLPYEAILQNTTAEGGFVFLFLPAEDDPAWQGLEEFGPDDDRGEGRGEHGMHVGLSGGYIDDNGTYVEEWNKPLY